MDGARESPRTHRWGVLGQRRLFSLFVRHRRSRRGPVARPGGQGHRDDIDAARQRLEGWRGSKLQVENCITYRTVSSLRATGPVFESASHRAAVAVEDLVLWTGFVTGLLGAFAFVWHARNADEPFLPLMPKCCAQSSGTSGIGMRSVIACCAPLLARLRSTRCVG